MKTDLESNGRQTSGVDPRLCRRLAAAMQVVSLAQILSGVVALVVSSLWFLGYFGRDPSREPVFTLAGTGVLLGTLGVFTNLPALALHAAGQGTELSGSQLSRALRRMIFLYGFQALLIVGGLISVVMLFYLQGRYEIGLG